MREVTGELVDRFVDNGECGFMDAFADKYPAQIICYMLGVPAEQQAGDRLGTTELRMVALR